MGIKFNYLLIIEYLRPTLFSKQLFKFSNIHKSELFYLWINNFMFKLDNKIIFLFYNMIVYKIKIDLYLKLIFIKIHVCL